MQEEKTMLPALTSLPMQSITEPVIKAYFNTELVKRGFVAVVNGINNLHPDKENLTDCYAKIKAAQKLSTSLDDFRKKNDPFYEKTKLFKKCMDELLDQISNAIASKMPEIKSVNDAIAAEKHKASAEKQRIETILAAITTFINNATNFITAAQSEDDIVKIQKRIGSEKSRDGFYGEYITDLREKCDALTPLINSRKENIKKGRQIMIDIGKAIEEKDDEKAAELRSELELMEIRMEENTLRLQEKAFEQALTMPDVIVAEPTNDTISGRNYWRYEVTDINMLLKKHPNLVNLVPNTDAIDELLREKRVSGELKGKTELEMPGLKFFIKNYL